MPWKSNAKIRPHLVDELDSRKMSLAPKKQKREPILREHRNQSGEIRRIRIDKIRVLDGRRPTDPAKVQAIAESMGKIGLQFPVTVKRTIGNPVLIAGLHRLEAAKLLGWSHIPVIYLEGGNARLWEISENLHRAELTVLEKAELLSEWAHLISKEAKVVQLARPGGQQPNDQGIGTAARKLGFSKDAIRRAKRIARISPEAKNAAKKANLEDNQRALLAISREPPNDQLTKVSALAKGKRKDKPSRASSRSSDDEGRGSKTTTKEDTLTYEAVKAGFEALDQDDRDRFLGAVCPLHRKRTSNDCKW